MSGIDVLITCAAGSEALITEELLGGRPDGGLLIVDIALPRNVDRAVANLLGRLRARPRRRQRLGAARAGEARAAEAARVRDIVADQLERFLLDSTARQAAPLVARLHDRAEAIRRREVERFASRLDKLAADDQETVAALTRAIVAKLLHEPSVRLRHDAGTPRGERNAAAVSDLFDLGPH